MSPRLLKGPTCQRSRGISHSQPPYCSPGHNGLHGAWPFVINSVVNFWWGNKSVTHLQLWIRTSFNSLFFFLLSFSDTLPMAVLSTSNVIFQTQKNKLSWSAPGAEVGKKYRALIFLKKEEKTKQYIYYCCHVFRHPPRDLIQCF